MFQICIYSNLKLHIALKVLFKCRNRSYNIVSIGVVVGTTIITNYRTANFKKHQYSVPPWWTHHSNSKREGILDV